jgi:zinc protease
MLSETGTAGSVSSWDIVTVGGTLAIGLPLEMVEFWPARISAVTRDQVEAAGRAVLASAPNTAAWLLPQA